MPQNPEQFRFLDPLSCALESGVSSAPSLPDEWCEETRGLVGSRWTDLSRLAKLSVAYFAELGQTFPLCQTLELLSRHVARHDLLPTVMTSLRRMQKPSGTVLLETAAFIPAALSLIDTSGVLSQNEKSTIEEVLRLLPPLIFAKVSSTSRTVIELTGDLTRIGAAHQEVLHETGTHHDAPGLDHAPADVPWYERMLGNKDRSLGFPIDPNQAQQAANEIENRYGKGVRVRIIKK